MPFDSHKILFAFALLALVGCESSSPTAEPQTSAAQKASSSGWTTTSLTPGSRSDSAATLFEELTPGETGINATCRLDLSHPMKRLYHSGFVCGGVAIGDLDGDDRPDIFFANGPDKNRLFFQTDSMKFEEYAPADTSSSIGGGDSWAAGVTLADIENDGDLDIYVCNYDRPNQLFINDGNRKFREAASAAKLDLVDACLNAAFVDFDRDGDLDVYVLTNRYYRDGGRPRNPPVGFINEIPYVLPDFSKYYALTKKPDGNYELDNAGRRDYFLTNNGDGTFTDATESIGHIGKGHGLSVSCWDHNHDGWPDIYIGNDFNDPDYLLHNNGDGTFTNVLKQAIPHTSWFSMGADFGDLNNDGLFDFLVADMSATTHYGQKTTMGAMNAEKMAIVAGPPPQIMKNALYVNSGTDRFLEAAELAGLADSDWTWAIKLADFDNDGRNDVFISNGMARSFTHSDNTTKPEQLVGNTEWDLHEDEPTRPEKNRAFRNLG
ncbi:MAG: VCBS repeat-containing protein, partial [Planctomycetota bacterium]